MLLNIILFFPFTFIIDSSNVMVRKPGDQVSTRKPLSDRTINKPIETKTKSTPKLKQFAVKTENLDEQYKLMVDGCSLKEEPKELGKDIKGCNSKAYYIHFGVINLQIVVHLCQSVRL